MIKEDLYNKYGRKLIDDIFNKGYLIGCTILINEDGIKDIPETDIRRAIREMDGQKIDEFEWD